MVRVKVLSMATNRWKVVGGWTSATCFVLCDLNPLEDGDGCGDTARDTELRMGIGIAVEWESKRFLFLYLRMYTEICSHRFYKIAENRSVAFCVQQTQIHTDINTHRHGRGISS